MIYQNFKNKMQSQIQQTISREKNNETCNKRDTAYAEDENHLSSVN